MPGDRQTKIWEQMSLAKQYNAAGRDWEEAVKNNARTVSTTHTLSGAGYHRLKVWMVDPAVVVQKIVVMTAEGEGKTSYLGPPESYYVLPSAVSGGGQAGLKSPE